MGLRAWIKRRALKAAIERFLKELERKGQLEFLKAFFGGSKKATAVFLGILTIVLKNLLNLDEATVDMIVKLISTYILGQGVVDTALAWKGAKTK